MCRCSLLLAATASARIFCSRKLVALVPDLIQLTELTNPRWGSRWAVNLPCVGGQWQKVAGANALHSAQHFLVCFSLKPKVQNVGTESLSCWGCPSRTPLSKVSTLRCVTGPSSYVGLSIGSLWEVIMTKNGTLGIFTAFIMQFLQEKVLPVERPGSRLNHGLSTYLQWQIPAGPRI